jgi:hypothetical protein
LIPSLFGREVIKKDAHEDFIYSYGHIGHSEMIRPGGLCMATQCNKSTECSSGLKDFVAMPLVPMAIFDGFSLSVLFHLNHSEDGCVENVPD